MLGVLAKLGMAGPRLDEMIELRNKIDLLGSEEQQAARNAAARGAGVVAGSAVTGEGCDTLLAEIEAQLFPRRMIFTLRLGHDEVSRLRFGDHCTPNQVLRVVLGSSGQFEQTIFAHPRGGDDR